MKLLVIKQS